MWVIPWGCVVILLSHGEGTTCSFPNSCCGTQNCSKQSFHFDHIWLKLKLFGWVRKKHDNNMQVFVRIFNGDILLFFIFFFSIWALGGYVFFLLYTTLFFFLSLWDLVLFLWLWVWLAFHICISFSSVSFIFAVELFLHSQPFYVFFFFDSTALIPSLLWRLPRYLEKAANAPFTFAFPRWK